MCSKKDFPEAMDTHAGSFSTLCLCSDDTRYLMRIHCMRHACPRTYCELCLQEFELQQFKRHLESCKHTDRRKKLLDYMFLLQLPHPSAVQVRCISSAVQKYAWERALTDNDVARRCEAFKRLQYIVKSVCPECDIRLYGSTINGFGTRFSDINTELTQIKNSEETLPESLKRIANSLSQINAYDELEEDFSAKTPKLRFLDSTQAGIKFRFEVSITSEKNWKTSDLLLKYSLLDERAKILGLALRRWAKTFKFDDQENGMWPPHTFPIMVIHYLQRCVPPVLPCFHEMLSKKMIKKKLLQEDGADEHDEISNEDFQTVQKVFVQNNRQSVGELWIGLFRYFAFDFDCGTQVVSIRKTGKLDTHADKGWGTRILAVEDPYRPTLNLSRSVGNIRIFDAFMQMWRSTYRYLMTPTTTTGPIFSEKNFVFGLKPPSAEADQPAFNPNHKSPESSADLQNGENSSEDEVDEGAALSKSVYDISEAKRLISSYGLIWNLNPSIETYAKSISERQYYYSFEFDKQRWYQKPPRFCRLCRKKGHTQARCPVERLPELIPLPDDMPALQKSILNEICINLYRFTRLTTEDEDTHQSVLKSLESFIKRSMPDANLELFGSAKNGFGATNCDLDICLTFSSSDTGAEIDQAQVITQLNQILYRHPDVSALQPITQAKVPILKFLFTLNRGTGSIFECDISLYNILAKYNTKLLRTYCEIDERIRILGFVVKHFAKSCDIGDASRGSLSSYAYTLMTIHFLQQCIPPVAPVLQELYEGTKPERLVDNWNTWFQEDVSKVKDNWPYWNKNQQTVAELFVNFLRYYTENFPFDQQVVCINQFEPLTKLKKNWMSKRIAIEDPFLLTHNLGQGVDDHMAAFIKTAFCKGRNLIGNPPDHLPPNYRGWEAYFFDRSRLTDGNMPTGRGCRHCGKIGHKVAECPILLKRKEAARENSRKQDRLPRSPRSAENRPSPMVGRGLMRGLPAPSRQRPPQFPR